MHYSYISSNSMQMLFSIFILRLRSVIMMITVEFQGFLNNEAFVLKMRIKGHFVLFLLIY